MRGNSGKKQKFLTVVTNLETGALQPLNSQAEIVDNANQQILFGF